MEEYSVIGKRLPMIDGKIMATGEAQYVGDLTLPKMLYGKILRSPYPHARIVHIDANKAEKLLGVKAVITGKDTLGIKYGISPELADEFPLAIDKVRYIGDVVAAIAAIDEDIAEESLELIKVDYEILPAIFDPENAMGVDAPIIHDHVRNNISRKSDMDFGNINKAFKESYLIQEDRF